MRIRAIHGILGAAALAAAALLAVACGSSSSPSIPNTEDASSPDTGLVPDTGADAAACVADLMNDHANCGRCGRDCGAGSTCSAGLCSPTELGATTTPVTALTAGATRVYWEASGVFGCAKTGCGGAPTTLLASSVANGGIDTTTLGDELVYFTISGSPGHIGRCNPGGTCTDDHVTTDLSHPSRIIATNADLFFATDLVGDAGGADASAGDAGDGGDGGSGLSTGGAVLRASLAGSSQTASSVVKAESVLGFAFAGSTLIWTDRTAGVTVCKLPCADPGPIPSAGTGVAAPPSGRPAIAGGVAFWPTVEGAIVRCSPMSCASTRDIFLPPSQERVVGDLASDGMTLYFAQVTTTRTSAPTKPSGQIAACPIDAQTCEPSALASGLPTPNRLAIDGTSAFWANGSDSTDGTFTALTGSAVLRVTR